MCVARDKCTILSDLMSNIYIYEARAEREFLQLCKHTAVHVTRLKEGAASNSRRARDGRSEARSSLAIGVKLLRSLF